MLLRKQLLALCFPVLVLCVFFGCTGGNEGPELGTVSGVVTLDGKPFANAAVYFEPQQGRTSNGLTNKDGRYELNYTKQAKGAQVGSHTVRITREPTVDELLAQGTNPAAKQLEPLPEKYNVHSTLKADVQAGDNTFDFELKSDEK